jgi:TolA-binding protein
MNSGKNPSMNFRAIALIFLTASGCSSLSRSSAEAEKAGEKAGNPRYSATEPADPENLKDQKIHHLESTVTTLNSRIMELEGKLQATQARPDHSSASTERTKLPSRQTIDALGSKVSASIAGNDPGAGFVNDGAVRAYQQGRILFDQEKFPEAILAYSAFLEGNPNHPLASSAQYSIAESYYRQGDYTVADQEFRKLTSRFPHSPRVSFALVRLSQSATALGKAEDAKRYRVQVEGLFPKSPALKLFRETPAVSDAAHAETPIATAPEMAIEHPSVPTIPAPTIEAPRIETPKVEAPKAQISGEELDGPPGGGG